MKYYRKFLRLSPALPVAQDGNVVQFKIKKKAQLRKLMTAYTERLGLQEGSVIFLYDGTVLSNFHHKRSPEAM